MAYIGRQNLGGAYRQLDDISSGFDGSDTTHTMQVNSTNVSVGDVNQILLSLGGVIQKPGTDFTVSGSTLTFTTAPAANTSFFAILLGSDNGGTVTPTDASVTVSKLAIAGGEVKLDADGDTSITADTDDQIDFKLGGVDEMTMSSSGIVINEGSNDRDFRIESNGNTHMLHVDGGNNRVGMITEPDLGIGLHIRESDSGGSIDAWADALVLEGSGDSGMTILSGNASDGSINWGDDGDNDAGRIVYNHNVNQLKFYNGGAERMAINTAGEVGIGLSSFDSQLVVSRATAGGSYSIFGIHSASSGVVRILRGSFSGQAPDDRNSVFITMGDSTTTRFNVHADGDVDNHDNFFGQISDQRIKSNITDANSQWDDIKAIKFRNFERKDDIAQYGNGKKVQIGVVAQELETVSPGLVRETEPTADDIKMSSEFGTLYEDGDSIPEDKNIGDIKTTTGEKVKAVAYSVLYIKAAKALQEAMARIETLEADVKTLKGE